MGGFCFQSFPVCTFRCCMEQTTAHQVYPVILPYLAYQLSLILFHYGYTLPTHFSLIVLTSSDNYEPSFKILKYRAEPLLLNFASQLTELCSAPFNLDELLTALEHYHSTSPGPNGIHNLILSHLPPTGKEFLLSMYSHIWSENLVPAAWRETPVIPILKSGKDHFHITSNGHVSLTSCVCKTSNHMVNHQLV